MTCEPTSVTCGSNEKKCQGGMDENCCQKGDFCIPDITITIPGTINIEIPMERSEDCPDSWPEWCENYIPK